MLLLVSAALALHATFGRAPSLELCRRMPLIGDAERARLALERPNSFGVCDGENLFVCTRTGEHVHHLGRRVRGRRRRPDAAAARPLAVARPRVSAHCFFTRPRVA